MASERAKGRCQCDEWGYSCANCKHTGWLQITGVAYRFPESAGGRVWSSPRPARHCCPRGTTEGFVLQDGTFVDRFEALKIAKANGQLIRKTGPEDRLFSEDLW